VGRGKGGGCAGVRRVGREGGRGVAGDRRGGGDKRKKDPMQRFVERGTRDLRGVRVTNVEKGLSLGDNNKKKSNFFRRK